MIENESSSYYFRTKDSIIEKRKQKRRAYRAMLKHNYSLIIAKIKPFLSEEECDILKAKLL